jgi:outer membrane protein OmpA-like peptidoglycan-associated protein
MHSMTYWRVCALSLLMIAAGDARAEAYMAAFGQAQWQVQRSPLVCRLTQEVPRLGEAVFEAAAGGKQRFVLRAKNNPLISGPAQLTAVAPSWNPARKPVALGTVEVAGGAEPLRLEAESATRLLDSLHSGLVPVIARPLQEDKNKIASIALSPINFLTAYRQYNECIDHLFPVTFDDIKNTVIEFANEQSELSAAAQKKIDFLLRYIAIDHSITQFEIQGISSDNKRLLDNLSLAKQRAQQVSEYLMSRGIDAKRIETSYHGERYYSGRHRFVAIRLIRGSSAD